MLHADLELANQVQRLKFKSANSNSYSLKQIFSAESIGANRCK